MGWLIQCSDEFCGKQTWASNIVDLIKDHTDNNGWFLCSCGNQGYIEKRYKLQEKDATWEPFLKGVIPLGDPESTYQPFVFLVSDKRAGPPDAVWFSYYKDLRDKGGRLKLGYGPGGPPVLDISGVMELLKRLLSIKCLTVQDLQQVIQQSP